MAKIHVLPQPVIDKIAAGEVVERPASVVKELVENSLDAGASDIRIDIEQGGLGLIRVTDNGEGMEPDDLRLAVQRYATSKIQDINDLNHLDSFGFRGEALATISAVSNFRVTSRTGKAPGAMELSFYQGRMNMQPAGGAVGTVVEVAGLFHPVPARKKFMKSEATEFRHIHTLVMQQACIHPHVAFKLTHNGETVFDAPAVADWKTRATAILGRDLAKDMLELKHQRASLTVTGFLSHPSQARSRKPDQYIFVNRRPVQDFMLAKAVRQGYSHHLEAHNHPAFILHISIAPDLVDVNVHPRKSEVRFADPSSLFREVYFAVHHALESVATKSVEIGFGGEPFSSSNTPAHGFSFDKPTAEQIKSSLIFSQAIASTPPLTMPQPAALGDWKLLGQLHKCFLLVESTDGLLIVDQHAAAEKILYERMTAADGEARKQGLLVPLLVELSPAQFQLVMEDQAVLATIGVDIEAFGPNTVRLTAIPQDMDVRDLKQFFLDLVADMQDEGKMPNALHHRRDRLANMAACRGAIKFQDALTHGEQIQLLSDVRRYHITACCHGRPVMKKLSIEQLRKEFHRP